jgi:hypothetical protein
MNEQEYARLRELEDIFEYSTPTDAERDEMLALMARVAKPA